MDWSEDFDIRWERPPYYDGNLSSGFKTDDRELQKNAIKNFIRNL